MPGDQDGQVVPAVSAPAQPVFTDRERAAARAHVERILSSPQFAHSKRYPAFLRYVVDRALDGHADELKERTIGVEAFGRPSAYDTSQDPVVRTTAGEVRKRIAQYYQQAGHEEGIRVELPVGSYVPEFKVQATPAAQPAARSAAPRRRWIMMSAATAAFVVVTLVGAAAWFRPWVPANQVDRFWRPVLETPGAVLLCVGPATADIPSLAPTPARHSEPDEVTLHAATTVSRMVGFLQSHGRSFLVRPADSVKFGDLREHAAAMVGGFNNAWTMKVTRTLRFGFDRNDAGSTRIVDRAHPGEPGWTRKFREVSSVQQVVEDFALVARVRDPASDQYVLIVAGIGRHGTAAAGECLTEPRYMDAVAMQAPPDWDRKNVEIVVATDVVDGTAGPPRIVATHFW